MDTKLVMCDCNNQHPEKLQHAISVMPKDEVLYDLAEFFKVFGDSARIKILCALFDTELCVCDIAALVGTTPSAVSHQLRILKQVRLVKYRKQGKEIYYSLDDLHVKEIFEKGLEHINERSGTNG